MKKDTLEYIIKASSKLLYNKLTTTLGLQQWFADKVYEKNKFFHFTWRNETAIAKIDKLDNNIIQFIWQDYEDNSYSEFKIVTHELTNDLALIIHDFSNKEYDFTKDFWDLSINKLKYVLGDNNNA